MDLFEFEARTDRAVTQRNVISEEIVEGYKHVVHGVTTSCIVSWETDKHII